MVDLFRSFQPFENPLGFGAVDYLEIAFAVLLLSFTLLQPFLSRGLASIARRPLWSMAGLAVLPVVLRLALLGHHPVPAPNIYDEFGHLFVADTLSHLRLANPMHPMHRFFETFFILQQPTYSSIYPLGQGLMLAIGSAIFRLPWAGVLLSTALLCALTYWMLRAWMTPEWALVGGLVAVMEFGPLSGWTNSYWGGSLAACAGCLVFGALPRLLRQPRPRDMLALGGGLGIHILTRPYESILLLFSVVLFFVLARRFPVRAAAVALGFIVGAVGMTAAQNRAVTGYWLTLPYELSQYQYGVPASLTFQPEPKPHVELTPQQQLEYDSQLAFRNANQETPASYLLRLEYRIRYYRFFFLAPLYVALVAYLFAFRSPHWIWVVSTAALFALGSNFYPFFQVHYIAALSSLFVLMSVQGLIALRNHRLTRPVATLVLFFCAAQFLFWYTLHVFETNPLSTAMRRFETWNSINHDTPTRHNLVARQLDHQPGQLLVFVRYAPQHVFQDEWVYNRADLDASRIVWARDRGDDEDEKLIRYYPHRTAWLLQPDSDPPNLTPYRPEPITGAAQPAQPLPVGKPPRAPQVLQPTLRLEQVK